MEKNLFFFVSLSVLKFLFNKEPMIKKKKGKTKIDGSQGHPEFVYITQIHVI